MTPIDTMKPHDRIRACLVISVGITTRASRTLVAGPAVKIGDRVKPGDVIGCDGNFGQSMEPHLHLELLDSPDCLTANGLPIVFANLNRASALDCPGFSAMNSLAFSEFIVVISE